MDWVAAKGLWTSSNSHATPEHKDYQNPKMKGAAGTRTFVVDANTEKGGEAIFRIVKVKESEWTGFEEFDSNDYSAWDMAEIPIRVTVK